MPNFEDLIGVKFIPYGKDPEIGLDCLGLLIEVYKRFGVIVPDFDVNFKDYKLVDSLINSEKIKSYWLEIEEPEIPCAVVFRNSCDKFITHLGMCIDKNKFIHCRYDVGSVVVEKLNHPFWSKKIVGFYKWNGTN